MMECVFSQLPTDKIIDSNELTLAFYDGYPVTQYHMFIIPKCHAADYFDLKKDEVDAIHDLIHRQKDRLLTLDTSITGFNIGINVGGDTGQSIPYTHCSFDT